MSTEQPSIDALARSYATTAAEVHRDHASYLRSLPEQAWSGPTGCKEWTVRDLAGHVVGEAVWFPTLVRGITRGEPAPPDELWESFKTLPPNELADTLEQAADSIVSSVDEATTEHLQQTVDLGFTKMPLWQATFVCLFESVYHHWDARSGGDPAATVPTPWAQQLATRAVEFAPLIASREAAGGAPGRYVLQVGDGVGPVTVTAQGGEVTIERGALDRPDVTARLSADQYVRLLAGRLDLARAIETGEVPVQGDRDRASGLNRIFPGV